MNVTKPLVARITRRASSLVCACLAWQIAGGFLTTKVQADDTVYIAVGHGGHRMTSRDGLAWENHVEWVKPGHDQNDLNVAACFNDALFVGGGYSYARLTATRDGKTCSEGRIPGGSPVFGLEVGGEMLYAVCLRGDVFKTTDGEQWELVGRADIPTKTHWIRGTTFGNGLIVGSGDFGPALVCDPETGKLSVTQMAGQSDENATWHRVAFGNGTFVVGGQAGLLAVTRDGKSWLNNETVAERGDTQCVE